MLINTSYPLYYINLCNIMSLSHIPTGPTHLCHNGSTSTIDLVFVPDNSMVNAYDRVPPLSNSDILGS